MRFLIWLVAIFISVGAAPVDAMEFREAYSGGNCSRCVWIAADGAITRDSAKKLSEFIQKNDINTEDTWLVVNSPGGDVYGGMELGLLVRAFKMNVGVATTITSEPEGAGRTFEHTEPGICASACVFTLMGGVKREVWDEESRIGVHQFAPATDHITNASEALSDAQSLVAIMHKYATEMDVNVAIFGISSSVKPDQMHWLSMADMEKLNLLTSRSKPVPSKWQLKPNGEALLARVVQEQQDGRTVAFDLSCHYVVLTIFGITADSVNYVGPEIAGATLGGGASGSADLRFRDFKVFGGGGVFAFDSDSDLLGIIANGSDDVALDLDLPHAYWGYLGSTDFFVPSSNLNELKPFISRMCAGR